MAQLDRPLRVRSIFALLLTACIVMPRLLPMALSQFNDERRRPDRNPISLPGGSTIEFKSFDSTSIGQALYYSVFLPPSFSKNPSRTYPVIYFLHGLNNDDSSWTVERYGHIQNSLEQMMLSGKLPEFLMVNPRGDSSF